MHHQAEVRVSSRVAGLQAVASAYHEAGIWEFWGKRGQTHVLPHSKGILTCGQQAHGRIYGIEFIFCS